MQIKIQHNLDGKETESLLLMNQENIDLMIEISEKIQKVILF